MHNYTRSKSAPRKLIQEAICELEQRFGSSAFPACLKLLQADELLLRSERALNANPQREWPQEIEAGAVLRKVA